MTDQIITDSLSVALTPGQEAQAVEDARRDPAAFTCLYRAYVRSIYRYLYGRLGNAEDAEDLTSQVFMEALEGLDRYRHRGYFLAWLFSIARHRLVNFYNRHPHEMDIEIDEIEENLSADSLAEAVQSEEKRNLLKLIHALKEGEQDLLRLRFVAELSFSEIGKLLGRSEEAVKKQLYRLLARLESQLEAGHD